MTPRPILKGSKANEFEYPHYTHQHAHHHQHHHSVHFPPSPSLTRTFYAHSASAYDRSPIIVSPNDCALPARGCPGRTYFDEPPTPYPSNRPSCMSNAKGYHPRAFSIIPPTTLPQLVPDFSSESEESDGISSLPTPSLVTFGPHGLPAPSSGIKTTNASLSLSTHTHGYASYDRDADTALSFLPYSPSSPPRSYPYEEVGLQKEKPRRRRDRRHESSIDPDRIPSGDAQTAQFAHAFVSFSISNSAPSVGPPSDSPSTPRKKSSRKHQFPPSLSFASGFSSLPDDGCLGGFWEFLIRNSGIFVPCLSS